MHTSDYIVAVYLASYLYVSATKLAFFAHLYNMDMKRTEVLLENLGAKTFCFESNVIS